MRHVSPRQSVLACAVLLGLGLFAPRVAMAKETTVWDRSFSLAIQGDPISGIIGPTPYGFGGASLGYSPVSWLAIDAAIGVASAGRPGRAAAVYTLMPRVRWTSGQEALAFGAGVSVGSYRWDEVPYDSGGATKVWDPAWRANVEVSYERRFDSGLFLRPYVGLAEILNVAAGVCVWPDEGHCNANHASDPKTPFGYWGLAIGYAQ
jgi:hypothetical protein